MHWTDVDVCKGRNRNLLIQDGGKEAENRGSNACTTSYHGPPYGKRPSHPKGELPSFPRLRKEPFSGLKGNSSRVPPRSTRAGLERRISREIHRRGNRHAWTMDERRGIGTASCALLRVFCCLLASWTAKMDCMVVEWSPNEGLAGAEVREGSLNPRPIVGIVSQPLGKHTNRSYIAASYVKWIEASGARVAPLIFDRSPQELRANFEAINGIVLPGGDASLTEDSPYFKTLKMLFGWAMEANSRGDYFPLYGACLGLEALAILVSGNHSVLSSTDAEDDPVPLHIATGTAESPFLGFLGEEQMKKATRESIAYENHDKALLLESFHADEKLRETFRLLTVSYDRYGRAYVSSMEGRDAPILALQFHPEKNSYEWNMAEHIPHSLDAVEFSQGVGNYVGKLARKSRHRPITSSQERSMLIYQYPVTYTGSSTKAGVESTFEEEYRFAPAVERTW